jgi:hypothetical protein
VQPAWPPSLYDPAAHGAIPDPSAFGHAYPAGHGVHADWFPKEKKPGLQADPAAVVDGHANPAGHPTQSTRAAAPEPYQPGWQGSGCDHANGHW